MSALKNLVSYLYVEELRAILAYYEISSQNQRERKVMARAIAASGINPREIMLSLSNDTLKAICNSERIRNGRNKAETTELLIEKWTGGEIRFYDTYLKERFGDKSVRLGESTESLCPACKRTHVMEWYIDRRYGKISLCVKAVTP